MDDIGQYRPPHATQTPPRVPLFAGCQFRMVELTGAVALAQIRRLDRMIAQCRSLHHHVATTVAAVPGLHLRELPDPAGIFGFDSISLPRHRKSPSSSSSGGPGPMSTAGAAPEPTPTPRSNIVIRATITTAACPLSPDSGNGLRPATAPRIFPAPKISCPALFRSRSAWPTPRQMPLTSAKRSKASAGKSWREGWHAVQSLAQCGSGWRSSAAGGGLLHVRPAPRIQVRPAPDLEPDLDDVTHREIITVGAEQAEAPVGRAAGIERA
jgi:hypothetical protein